MSTTLSDTQKKKFRRNALRELGHQTTASAIAEIRTVIPGFHKTRNYPKVKGICPPMSDLVLYARGLKSFAFDHETGFISGNQRDREARSFSRPREDRFSKRGQPWHIGG